MVGAAGFELATLCSQSRCATRLRYAPTGPILTRWRAILQPALKVFSRASRSAGARDRHFHLTGHEQMLGQFQLGQ